NRDDGVNERQGAAANAGHAAGAVGLEDVGHDADRVGELVGPGDDGLETSLGQRPVSDLAAARSADGPALPDTERREVVIEHELLAIFFDQPVHALLVTRGAEGGGYQRLRLAALEDGGAVG